MDEQRDTFDDDVHLSNKHCRRYYTRSTCTCPEGRCWYDEQLERRKSGRLALRPEAWRKELEE